MIGTSEPISMIFTKFTDESRKKIMMNTASIIGVRFNFSGGFLRRRAVGTRIMGGP
jgi:hypothetical protein